MTVFFFSTAIMEGDLRENGTGFRQQRRCSRHGPNGILNQGLYVLLWRVARKGEKDSQSRGAASVAPLLFGRGVFNHKGTKSLHALAPDL